MDVDNENKMDVQIEHHRQLQSDAYISSVKSENERRKDAHTIWQRHVSTVNYINIVQVIAIVSMCASMVFLALKLIEKI